MAGAPARRPSPAVAAAAIESEAARQLAARPGRAASADRAAIEHEVARQFAALLAASGGVGSDARSDAAAMLQAIPDEGRGEMAPLVMGATERAIVRLTHRIGKLEEWRHAQATGERLPTRAGRGLMGRLFET